MCFAWCLRFFDLRGLTIAWRLGGVISVASGDLMERGVRMWIQFASYHDAGLA